MIQHIFFSDHQLTPTNASVTMSAGVSLMTLTDLDLLEFLNYQPSEALVMLRTRYVMGVNA